MNSSEAGRTVEIGMALAIFFRPMVVDAAGCDLQRGILARRLSGVAVSLCIHNFERLRTRRCRSRTSG
jgi:hypothetical protein